MRPLGFLVLCVASSLCVATAAEDKWVEVKSPHFSIITAGSTALAKNWLVGMEAMRADLNEMVPFPDDAPAPLRVVVFGRAKAFEALFVDSKEEKYLQYIRVVIKTNNRAGRFSGVITDDQTIMMQKSLFYQTALSLVDGYGEICPAWFKLGLQDIYGLGEVTGGGYKIGVSGSFFTPLLGDELKMPLAALIEPESKAIVYQRTSPELTAEIWCFTYYLLLGDKGANRPKLAKYLAAWQRGAGREVAEREGFTEGMAAVQSAFMKYVKHGSFRTVVRPVAPAIVQGITMQPAREADIQLVFGRVLLYSSGSEQAEIYLRKAQELDPENPEVYEALAELAEVKGDEPERLRMYDLAVAKGSRNFQANFVPARERAKPFLGGEASVDRYDPKQIREAIEMIKRAIRLNPRSLMPYQSIAGLMGSVTETAPDDLELLQTGDRLFPDRPVLKAGLAACDIRAGRFDEAAARLEALSAQPDDSGIYQYAAKLQRRIKAIRALARAESLITERKYDEAEAMAPELHQYQFLDEERVRLESVSRHISVAGLLVQLRKALEKKNWSMVEIYEQQLARESVPAALEAEHKQLLADLASERPK